MQVKMHENLKPIAFLNKNWKY